MMLSWVQRIKKSAAPPRVGHTRGMACLPLVGLLSTFAGGESSVQAAVPAATCEAFDDELAPEAYLRSLSLDLRGVVPTVGLIEFADSSMPEWEFLARLSEEADCGLLLDVNNVYVSSFNHRFDPIEYIDAIPADRVVQYHLAGHTNKGTHIIDTHSDHAIDEVWELYAHAVKRTGLVATLYEWDEDVPSFNVVATEARKAAKFRRQVAP